MVQNIEQQVAILLHGKHQGQKKKIQEILSDVTRCVREVFLLSQFGYRNVYKPERTMPDGTRSWRDTPRHVPEIGIKG